VVLLLVTCSDKALVEATLVLDSVVPHWEMRRWFGSSTHPCCSGPVIQAALRGIEV